MARKRNEDFFWVSYSDLLTTLFFVMMILFVLTIVHLKVEQNKTQARVEELEKIVRLEEQFKLLEDDEDFVYLEDCKKFVAKELRGIEIFQPNKTEIKEQYIAKTIEIGEKIEAFLNKLQEESKEFSYLLVIEGNMANSWDRRFNEDAEYGYLKSFERALAVYDLWIGSGVSFRKGNVEILISGSGFNGLCREQEEENNKRFSIQIIPKVSNHL